MIQKITKTIISICLSIITGCLCGYLFFTNYNHNIDTNTVYMVEGKEYDSLDLLTTDNNYNDYTYYTDDNKYYKVLGFTSNKNNLDKISNLDNNIKLVKCHINNEDFYNIIQTNDIKLKESSKDNISSILKETIDYYKSNSIELYKTYN